MLHAVLVIVAAQPGGPVADSQHPARAVVGVPGDQVGGVHFDGAVLGVADVLDALPGGVGAGGQDAGQVPHVADGAADEVGLIDHAAGGVAPIRPAVADRVADGGEPQLAVGTARGGDRDRGRLDTSAASLPAGRGRGARGRVSA
ncbi:hypothetical protein [Kitasatospora griseola]